ncbi:MAG: hypothetical protein JKY65_08125 [Planctomycetes bacterium]|nr:hypothetical protein [Planctomycetota bacterium]
MEATVPPDADRFDLGNKFGSGREPALRELWKNQERILQRLEAITDQVGNLVQAQADEVAHLRLRAERAERICTQAFSQAQTRASRWEAAVSGLAARSEVHTRAADPAPGSTQQLVRLLRDAITAQPEPVPEPEPQKPDPLEVLRERLFAMGNEHQSLVQRHASLLENLLGLLDPEDD